MEAFLFYLGKMIFCSGVMFTYYLVFLKDKTFHHYNRFYLLLTVIVSLVLPLIKVSYFTIETNQNLYLLLNKINYNQSQILNYDFTIYTIFYTAIGLVSVYLLIRLIAGIIQIETIKKQFPKESINGISFYQTNLENAPFSYFRNLFWKQSMQLQSTVGQQILKHEMVHIQQKHSWDKLLMQTVKSVFWFNPMFYFINKEINLIHEYLADHKAVKKADTKAFAQMLLESHFSGSVIPVTSPFLSSNLKKRLTMLTKNQTKYSYARKLFALPILFFMGFAYLVNAKNKEIRETNKVIELAVDQLQNDTIKSNTLDSIAEDNQDLTKAYSDAVQEDHLKMSSISKKMADKGKELSNLKKAKQTNTTRYKALEDDLKNLADDMQGIVQSDNYQKNIKALKGNSEAHARYFDSPEFKKRITDAEKRGKEAEAMVNSPEFKKRIADAEKRGKEAAAMVNSPDFKKRIAEAERSGKEAAERVMKMYSSGDFEKLINSNIQIDLSELPNIEDFPQFNFNFEDAIANQPAYKNLSPKELKKLEKKRNQLLKKQKELQEQQQELQQKQQELRKELGQNKLFRVSANFPTEKQKLIIFNSPQLANNQEVADLYINGKKVSNSQLEMLDPQMISSMDVLTSNNVNTIKIFTK